LICFFGQLDECALKSIPKSVKKLGFAITKSEDYNTIRQWKPSDGFSELREYKNYRYISLQGLLFSISWC